MMTLFYILIGVTLLLAGIFIYQTSHWPLDDKPVVKNHKPFDPFGD